jgi:hypothetical protein
MTIKEDLILFDEIIKQLKNTEQEIRDLKRDKAQAEHFLALVMSYVGELEVDITNIYKVDYEKVRLLPDEENISKVKVFYVKD